MDAEENKLFSSGICSSIESSYSLRRDDNSFSSASMYIPLVSASTSCIDSVAYNMDALRCLGCMLDCLLDCLLNSLDVFLDVSLYVCLGDSLEENNLPSKQRMRRSLSSECTACME
jgi:hypothetical protein